LPLRRIQVWLGERYEQGLSAEQYIELKGNVIAAISIDDFYRAYNYNKKVTGTTRKLFAEQIGDAVKIDSAAVSANF
jgi:hypothetical protein